MPEAHQNIKVIAVVAANGRSGREFVRAALDAGYSVRAGCRGAHDFEDNAKLAVIQVDATVESDVERLLDGADAVVSLIGHVKGSPAKVQTKATQTVLSVMKKQGITRIVSLTGSGVRLRGDKPSPIDRLLNVAIKVIDPARISDGIEHVEILKKSGVEWTVVRVLKLTNGAKHDFFLSSGGPAQLFTSRKTVAEAILGILRYHGYMREAPVVSRLPR